MENNFLKASSKNKAGKILFYIFEIAAACIGFILFIMSIVNAATFENFSIFIDGFLNVVMSTLIIFGIGKVIDLLYCANDSKKTNSENNK